MIGLIWIICGILSYGITFGYFQNKYPRMAEKRWVEDFRFAVFFGILGPIGLSVSFPLSGFVKYGLKF